MAKGRIEQEIAVKVTGLDDVKDIDERIDKLGKRKAKLTLDADTADASKKLSKVDDEIDALNKRKAELTVTADTKAAVRDIQDVLDKVDRLGGETGQILLASNATTIANEIGDLIIDIDRLDANDPEVTVKVDQIHALEADLDRLSAKAKEVGATPITLDTTRAKAGLDDVGRSADSSRSVLANMVGNTTQDLGALGGVAGSAGVAIGQMGEYMADAAGSGDKLGSILKNFGTVAAPLAAIGVVTKVITDEFARNAAAAKANEEQITTLFDAFREGQTVLDVFAKTVEETGKLEFDVGDIVPDLEAVNLKVSEFSKLAEGPPEKVEEWAAAQRKLVTEGTPAYDSMRDVVFALVQANAQAAEATKRHDATVQVLADTYTTEREAILAATIAQRARVDELNRVDEAKRARDNALAYAEFGAGMHDLAVKQQEATDAAKAFNDTIASTDFAAAGIEGATAGMSAFHDQFFSLADIAANTEAAFDGLGQSLEDNGKSFDLNTEAGRNNQKAIEDLSSAMDTQLAAALADSSGSFAEFDAKAKTIANTLRDRLINEMGLSGDEADDMIRRLGLLPGDIETRYTLSGTEEAKLQLELLQGTIDRLPKNVQAVIDYKILMGDYVGAVQTAQNYANRHPVTIPVELRVTTANLTAAQMRAINEGRGGAEGFESSPPGAYAGEAGPEFIRRPGHSEELLTHPAFIPTGTRVTSARRTRTILARSASRAAPVTAAAVAGTTVIHHSTTINAAVVGNRYDVAQAVGQGVRDLRRLLGTRGTGGMR